MAVREKLLTVEMWDKIAPFLPDLPRAPATNNRAEREIRPAVIIRKRSLHNRSQKGAHCQAVFMSIYRSRKLQGLDLICTMATALKEYVRTGSLPPLPDPGARDPS